jgi:hypothetical protein
MARNIALDLSGTVTLTVTDGTREYRITASDIQVERMVERELPAEKPPRLGQCSNPWKDERYSPSGTLTFCQAGCLVTALASLAVWAGYDTDPRRFARKIGEEGAFIGDLLGHPSRVTRAYDRLVWHTDGVFWSPRYSRNETSFIDWRSRAVDLELLDILLERQPVVVEVDFKPQTPQVDQHFVLAIEYRPDPAGGIEDDLLIMDPWTGSHTSVLTYFNPVWLHESALREGRSTKVARTVMGARMWEVAYD